MYYKPVKNLGFTLMELMVTVSIAALLMAMAIPSFVGSISSNRLTTQANELITALNLARSEAVKRGIQVTIRRNASSPCTTSQNWECGWDVFVDIAETPSGNTIGTFQDDTDSNPCEVNTIGTPIEDCLIKSYPALNTGYTLRTGANFGSWFGFSPTGAPAASGVGNNDTFRLCDSTANTAYSRSITVNIIGRAQVSQAAASCP